MLIGLDLSTRSTGFAFGGQNDGSPKGGTWKVPGADELVFDRTLAEISDSIGNLCRAFKIQKCFIEAPIVLMDRSAHTMAALMQLTGAARAAAKRAGCSVHLVAISTVRKHFVGTGNMKSAEAKAAIQARCKLLGWPFVDDNHADANAVWSYGMKECFPLSPGALAGAQTPLLAKGAA